MGTLRAVGVLAALAPVTIVGMGVQRLALAVAPGLAAKIPHAYHRYVLRVLGIRRRDVGTLAASRPLLLAANHVSWLDIVVLSSVAPVSFVAKREVAGWPVIGTLARLQRSIFVDRTRRTATGATAAEMGRRLAAGDPIVLFAEGTSNDGNRVLPFRSALIGAVHQAISGADEAAESTVLIQPVSIAYTRRHGLPMGRAGRPDIAWYGDMDLGPHLWGVLKEGAIDVTVSFGAPIPAGAGRDRKALAVEAERAVRAMTAAALQERHPP